MVAGISANQLVQLCRVGLVLLTMGTGAVGPTTGREAGLAVSNLCVGQTF